MVLAYPAKWPVRPSTEWPAVYANGIVYYLSVSVTGWSPTTVFRSLTSSVPVHRITVNDYSTAVKLHSTVVRLTWVLWVNADLTYPYYVSIIITSVTSNTAC